MSKLIYELTSTGPFASDFKFRDQIRASAGSIMDNIAEGFNRGGNKEFIQFLHISQGSLAETRSQLYRANDVQYLNDEVLQTLLEMTDSIGRKTSSLIQHLKKSEYKGIKFRQVNSGDNINAIER